MLTVNPGQRFAQSLRYSGDSAVPDVPTIIRTSVFRFQRVPGLDLRASGRARAPAALQEEAPCVGFLFTFQSR